MPSENALDDDQAVVREGGVERRAHLRLRPHLADPHRGAEPGRLDEHRRAEDGQLVAHRVRLAAPAVLAHGGGGDLRHGRGGQHLLEHDLVHAQRRGEHAGADVGHVEQLEQALDGAVLAERPVQDGEDGVGAEQAAAGAERQRRRRRASTRPSARSSPAAPRGRRPPPPRARTRPSSARPRARTSARRPGRRPSWHRRSARASASPSASAADDDRHAAPLAALLAGGRALVEHDAVLRRVGDRPRRCTRTSKPASSSVGLRLLLGQVDHVGDRRRLARP